MLYAVRSWYWILVECKQHLPCGWDPGMIHWTMEVWVTWTKYVEMQSQASWFGVTGRDFVLDAHNVGGINGNGQVSRCTFLNTTHLIKTVYSLGGNTSNLTHAPTVTVVHSRSHYHTSNEPRFGISTLTHHRFGVIPSRTLWMWCTMVWSATLRMGMKRLLVWSMCLLQWFFLRALAFFFSFSLLAFCFGESGD